MRFSTALHTDIGIKKSTNQDSALILEAKTAIGNVLLAVVCDGMGGLAKGEVASATVIYAFRQWFENELPEILLLKDPEHRIMSSWEKVIFSCNDKIGRHAKEHGVSMGTTLAAILFVKDKYYLMSVGDSRIYKITENVHLLTKDHTYVQREIDLGRMTPEQAAVSPQRSVLLQCIGASEYIVPDFFTGSVGSAEIYMICSDGFRHVISEKEIYERLNPNMLVNEKYMLDNAVYLTDLNKYRRENDNITVVLVRVD